MDKVDRDKILSNWNDLILKTNFDSLLRYMSERNVFTEAEIRIMTSAEFSRHSVDRKNSEFYRSIKTRGPKAFEHLVAGLHATGHEELALKLDPASIRPANGDGCQLYPRYEDNGKRIVFIVSSWNDESYKSDRTALIDMFDQCGYQVRDVTGKDKKEVKALIEEEVSSCIVLNFSKYVNDADRIYVDDEVYCHGIFHDRKLKAKPKILISFRYVFNTVQTDSSRMEEGGRFESDLLKDRPLYSDMLLVKVYIDGKEAKSSSEKVSTVVEKFIHFCSIYENVSFTKQLYKVERCFEDATIEVENVYFDKEYYLRKQGE